MRRKFWVTDVRPDIRQTAAGAKELSLWAAFPFLNQRMKVHPVDWDAAFLLTVGSFLLTVELFYLQLTILAFLLILLTALASLLTVGAFLLTVGKCV